MILYPAKPCCEIRYSRAAKARRNAIAAGSRDSQWPSSTIRGFSCVRAQAIRLSRAALAARVSRDELRSKRTGITTKQADSLCTHCVWGDVRPHCSGTVCHSSLAADREVGHRHPPSTTEKMTMLARMYESARISSRCAQGPNFKVHRTRATALSVTVERGGAPSGANRYVVGAPGQPAA